RSSRPTSEHPPTASNSIHLIVNDGTWVAAHVHSGPAGSAHSWQGARVIPLRYGRVANVSLQILESESLRPNRCTFRKSKALLRQQQLLRGCSDVHIPGGNKRECVVLRPVKPYFNQ